MTDTRRRIGQSDFAPSSALPAELSVQIAARRGQLGLTKKGLAERAGKVREVIYRIEEGQDVNVSSLVDVLRVLGLKLALVPAGIPSMEDVAKVFNEDDDAA
ncbi:MAG: helix-turn-helix domain-containing protein [Caulobacter sp.]|nr:helix-turn-helix domain-containing protein [Vitreoscilla sp.]